MINLLRRKRIVIGKSFGIFSNSGNSLVVNVKNRLLCNDLFSAHVVNFYRSSGTLIGSVSFDIDESSTKQITFNIVSNEIIYVHSTAPSFMGAQCYIEQSTSIPADSVVLEDASMDLPSIGASIKLIFANPPSTVLNLRIDTVGVFP